MSPQGGGAPGASEKFLLCSRTRRKSEFNQVLSRLDMTLLPYATDYGERPGTRDQPMGGVLSTSIEMCAGAGGQAVGLERASFGHEALVEIESDYCKTPRFNRPQWNVVNRSLTDFEGRPFKGIDLLAGGLPCPPFSVAGKQLGDDDERNLFPEALRLVDECRPRAIMIENVRGFLDGVFEQYRLSLKAQLRKLGYDTDWRLLNAPEFGVPQSLACPSCVRASSLSP